MSESGGFLEEGADTTGDLCEFLVVEAERVVLVAPAQQFLQIPKSVSIGGSSPKIVNWAQIEGGERPRLILLLESSRSEDLDNASVAISPNLPRATCVRMRPETLASPCVGPAILTLMFKDNVENSRVGPGWSNILALAQLFDIESRVTRQTNGRQMATLGPHFTFRTFIDRHSLPSGLIFDSEGGKRIALPVEIKLTPPGANGRSLAEIRAWAADDDAETATEAGKAASLLMLEGGRATRVMFA